MPSCQLDELISIFYVNYLSILKASILICFFLDLNFNYLVSTIFEMTFYVSVTFYVPMLT